MQRIVIYIVIIVFLFLMERFLLNNGRFWVTPAVNIRFIIRRRPLLFEHCSRVREGRLALLAHGDVLVSLFV